MQTDIELINTEVYAGRLKDKKDLNNSSSGGQNGRVVAPARFKIYAEQTW